MNIAACSNSILNKVMPHFDIINTPHAAVSTELLGSGVIKTKEWIL